MIPVEVEVKVQRLELKTGLMGSGLRQALIVFWLCLGSILFERAGVCNMSCLSTVEAETVAKSTLTFCFCKRSFVDRVQLHAVFTYCRGIPS